MMELKDSPWKDPIHDRPMYLVFEDKYPVTKGHLLFVPKLDDKEHVLECYRAAYELGQAWVENGYCRAIQHRAERGRKCWPDRDVSTHTPDTQTPWRHG